MKLFAASMVVAVAVLLGCSHPGPIDPSSDFGKALAEAAGKKSLVVVDFYTDWCGWCKKLDEDVYPDSAVSARLQKMVFAKIDAEKGDGPELAKRYHVDGFPTIVFVTSDGTEVHRIDGYMPASEFVAEIDQACAKAAARQ